MRVSKEDIIEALLKNGVESTKIELGKMKYSELRDKLNELDPLGIGQSKKYLIDYLHEKVGYNKKEIKNFDVNTLTRLARDTERHIIIKFKGDTFKMISA